jgi:hypothetical protein
MGHLTEIGNFLSPAARQTISGQCIRPVVGVEQSTPSMPWSGQEKGATGEFAWSRDWLTIRAAFGTIQRI